jgi:hypothetical protein
MRLGRRGDEQPGPKSADHPIYVPLTGNCKPSRGGAEAARIGQLPRLRQNGAGT